MAKYDPLRRYLSGQKTVCVELTFPEIERLIGGFLPKAATRPQWWNEASRNGRVQVRSRTWGEAGFRAGLAASERVVFERA